MRQESAFVTSTAMSTMSCRTASRSKLPLTVSLIVWRISASRVFSRRRSEEHTSELQSLAYLVCRLLLEKKKDPIRAKQHTSALQSLAYRVSRLLLEKKHT